MSNRIIGLLLAVIVVAAGALYVLRRPLAPSTPGVSSSFPVPVEPADLVTVGTQRPGPTVTISRVKLAASGYVIIHEAPADVPGRIIGQSGLLTAGEHRDVVVAVLGQTVNGADYVAMLHADDGDGTFSETADQPMRDALGAPIMVRFEAADESAETGEVIEEGNRAAAPAQPPASAAPASRTYTVEARETGFTPATLTVRKGDAVTFVNRGAAPSWPASGVHPTHQICPGFDALRGLKTGEAYAHTFTETRECPFHDHLNAALRGKITVTE